MTDYTAPSPELSIPETVEANLKMMELREREACGLPILGSFTIALVEGLEQLERSWCFYATMEFPVIVEKIKSGVKPACDAAVVAIVDGSKKPLVLFEYKPVVHTRKYSLGRQDLMEVLIQGYYCLYQHDVSSIVHCLTDLEQFYYFKMEKAEMRKMRISWNFSLSKQSLNAHLNFWYPILKEAFPA